MTEDGKKTGIEVLSSEKRLFPPSEEFSAGALLKSTEEYERLYKESIDDPDRFWGRMAEENITWSKKWETVSDYDFKKPYIKWFAGATLNASVNCLDRHLAERGSKKAIIWEADDGRVKTYTYKELFTEVCRFANVLRKKGVKKGDRVTLYLPMVPELAISVLACARVGAIHSVVFGGFSPDALRSRIHDSASTMVITSDEGVRGGKTVPIKANTDKALEGSSGVESVIVVKRTGAEVSMTDGRDTWWHDEVAANGVLNDCVYEEMDAEDPLFILYTSGSTGKPKGVLHTTGGYMVYAATTFKYVFDYKDDDIFFCTADIGWITGHSYIIYGPLSQGATALIFEGIPTYPEPDRFWEIVAKHKVTTFYTAPTAIRALMRFGDEWVSRHDLTTLRLLGTVGEPINPKAWCWYYDKVGGGKLPVVDTWWQTETGGILITPLPGAHTLKPGSAGRPFFGVVPKVLDEGGEEVAVGEGGYLVIDRAWPGILRGTYGDAQNKRMKEVYFDRFPGRYFTGDGARVDEDGDWWLMGRIDDVINVSGHRLGTAEIESALVAHADVAEAAVVGFPHEIKGDGIYAFVVLKEDVEATGGTAKELAAHVREIISPIAKPDKIQIAQALPKTRSGKIMRRILRKIAAGDTGDLGDTSTLADPGVVDELVDGRVK